MREETQDRSVCVFCKLAITQEQRPSVTLENGDEIHMECYNAWDRTQPRPTEKKAWQTFKRLRDSAERKELRIAALA